MEIVDLRTVKPPDELSPALRRLLSPLLAPLSGIYWTFMRARRAVPAGRTDMGVPVVSVGSLAVGGTGKTPLCMWIAQRFRSLGRRVCILSRGYRRKCRRSPLVVSDGRALLAEVEEAGDEPYMMAKRLPEVAVIVGKNRLRSALEARDSLGSDLLVLDDGFQERHLHRDADILCFDEVTINEPTAPLPWGNLREGWSALRPEHLVVLRLDGRDSRTPARQNLERLKGAGVFRCVRSEPALVDSRFGEVAAKSMDGQPMALVSGIARPGAFERSSEVTGVDLRVSIRFEDHHWYGGEDIVTIRKIMERYGAGRIITTEKDIWKLPARLREISLILTAGVDFLDREAFLEALDARLKAE